MASKVRTEHEEQRDFVAWWRRTQPHRIFAIPNGGARGIVAAGRLKLEGVSRGVPDLFVPALSLWIEMKRTTGGRLGVEQRDWQRYLEGLGHTVLVCRGAEDARRQVEVNHGDSADEVRR